MPKTMRAGALDMKLCIKNMDVILGYTINGKEFYKLPMEFTFRFNLDGTLTCYISFISGGQYVENGCATDEIRQQFTNKVYEFKTTAQTNFGDFPIDLQILKRGM